MARGKETCRILKEIRRQIAEVNDIEFITSECRYKGDCLGTCPKCEAEVRYLEQQLRARSLAGKAVTIAGISAGMILMSGCSGKSSSQSNIVLTGDTILLEQQTEMPDSIMKNGEIPNESDKVCVIKEKIDVPAPEVGEIIDPDGEEKAKVMVDVLPTFPGGYEKLYEWISQHIVYPPNARDSHIEGRIVVQFMVNVDGTIGDAEITRSVDKALDKEALRVVKSLPRFNPAMLDGKAVECAFTLPIIFKLTD